MQPRVAVAEQRGLVNPLPHRSRRPSTAEPLHLRQLLCGAWLAAQRVPHSAVCRLASTVAVARRLQSGGAAAEDGADGEHLRKTHYRRVVPEAAE